MPIRPRFAPGGTAGTDERQFTDREEFIAAFEKAMAAPQRGQPVVLVFYGVGGIGKTALRRHLAELLTERTNVVWGAVDFDVPAHCDQENALFVLRRVLHSRFRVSFPTFDIAYAVYWQKTRPQLSLARETFPLLEESDMVGELLSVVGNVPLLGALPKLPMLIARGSRLMQEWWTRRGSMELQGLPHMEAAQVAERLPMFWAADLRDHLVGRDRRAVIFLDTYEALTETERSAGKTHFRDAWVRELVAQLPEVLWVVCGREMLRWAELDRGWNECLSQFLVGGLAAVDAQRFLESSGILDAKIRDVIIRSSNGLPYYLDLAIDTYREITRSGKQPAPADFARAPTDVLVRFLRHLNQSEVETLKVLSVTRCWDRELFELLVNRFGTGYPLTAYDTLCRFSFIEQGTGEGTWKMHRLMRASLRDQLDPSLRQTICRVLFDHYSSRLKGITARDIDSRYQSMLAEAFYYGRQVLPPPHLVGWFIVAAEPFIQAARWQWLVHFFGRLRQDVVASSGPFSVELGNCLNYFALLQRKLGRYEEAAALYAESLTVRERVLGPVHPEVAQSLNNIAALYYEQGRYREAEPLFRRALEIRTAVFGPDHPDTAGTANNLAALCYREGRYDEAQSLYERSLRTREAALGPNHPAVATALMNLASLYRAKGNLAQAEPLLQRALRIREVALGPDHPAVAEALDSMALLSVARGQSDQAEPLCRRALAIEEAACGPDHPDVASACVCLATVCTELGRHSEAEQLYQRALTIWRQSLGPDHPYLARALLGMGRLRIAQNQASEAVVLLRQALAIKEKVLGHDHHDVAEIVNLLAGLGFNTAGGG